MIFTYNDYDVLEQSKVFLANPSKKYIGELSGVKNLHFKNNFCGMGEASFTIYQFENDEENLYYEKIEGKRLIEIQYVGWFQISKVENHDDGVNPYKNISLVTLENQLTSKKITNLKGTYMLYDPVNTDYSILNIVASITGWSIQHCDNELLGKFRTFSIDSDKVYSFLMGTCSTSFECIFQFDSYSKSISCYKLDNIGKVTDITISRNNILKEFIKESSADKIITKLRILGADGVDISDVNPSGTDFIINLDYYMTEQWMSEDLLNALEVYQNKYNSNKSSYQTAIALYKTKQAELTSLNLELDTLETNLHNAQNTQGDVVSSLNRTPIASDDRYIEYITALSNITTYTNQINSKNNEIASKEVEVNNAKATLTSIGNALDMNNNFSAAQLDELGVFLTEDAEYQDSSFQITEDMTAEDILAMKEELLENGYYELSLACKPQYTYKTTAINLFSIIEDKDEFLTYDKWKNDLVVGNFISIMVREDYYVTLRLLSMEFDFNKLEDIDLTFSDLPRNSDKQSQYAEILANASKTSNSYSFSKFGYDKAAAITNDVQEFMTSTFNATTNKLVNSDNITTEFGRWGIRNKEWLPDQNKYSDYQSWWTNNTLLFTDSNWSDSKAGIGVFTDSSGNKSMAVMADVICGRLIMSQRLNITNSSGTYTITDETGFQASKDGYSVTINPNTPSEIFKIAVNGSNSMYVDTVNKKLVMNGVINASSGTLGSLQITGTLSGGEIYGSSITTVGYGAGYYSKTLIDDGFITSHLIKIRPMNLNTYDFSPDSSGYLSLSPSGITLFTSATQANFYANSDGSIYGKYMTLTDDLNVGIINGGLPITYVNMYQYLADKNHTHTGYASSSHTQSSYTITPVTTTAGNISLLGSPNAASPPWCEATFQPLSSSDFRLKKNIQTLDLPDELFMNLKPKQFEFKCDDYNKGLVFGLLAQQVEAAFSNYGYDPYLYNLIELTEPKTAYTDEGLYVGKDKVHRINYNNLISWNISITQKLYQEIQNLKNEINTMKANG